LITGEVLGSLRAQDGQTAESILGLLSGVETILDSLTSM